MHPGPDGGDRRRQEGADRHRRRLPGERAVVEGAAAGRARPVAWRSSPSLAIGDGALGFWKAMRQVWDTTKEQRCWVHKTANVLDKLPKGIAAEGQADAPRHLPGRDAGRRPRRRSTCS